jgi:hypothetical protein
MLLFHIFNVSATLKNLGDHNKVKNQVEKKDMF